MAQATKQAPATEAADETQGEASANPNARTTLTKMSVKTLGCNPGQVKVDKKDVPLCRIFGIARTVIAKTGNNGDPVFGLKGNFEGLNYQNGAEADSGVLYLPNGIQELVEESMKDANGDEQAVQFDMDIIAIEAANPAGYSFKAVRHGEATRADPLAALRNSRQPLRALPAPKAA